MTTKKTTNWIRMTKDTLLCMRCGAKYTMAMPVPLGLYADALKSWQKSHKGCKAHPQGDVCGNCSGRGHALDACPAAKADPHVWLKGSDTGVSSQTLWCVMMGDKRWTALGSWEPDAPYDPDDFGRSYRLLKLFPAWRARLDEMKPIRGWSGLVGAWDELEKLYEEELPKGIAPKLYDRMQALR